MSVASSMAFAGYAIAGTSTWLDAGVDEFWSTAGNWDVPPVSGDDLVFSGVSNSFMENDLEDTVGSGVFTAASILFDADAGDFFEINGNALNLDGGSITNDSPNQHDIYSQIIESGGGLTVGGAGDLTIDDINNSSWQHSFVKNGAGRVYVGNSNDSFVITVNEGTLEWETGNAAAPSMTIHGGTFACVGSADPLWYKCALNLPNDGGTTPSTFCLPANLNVECGALSGAAGSVIDTLGTTGELSVLVLRSSGSHAGSIADGAGGARTGLELNNADGDQVVSLSGANTYTGGTVIAPGATLMLESTGSLLFKLEDGGVSNPVSGGGLASLDGTINFDLSELTSTTIGDTWPVIESSVSYGENFAVGAPFTETSPGSGTWYYNDGSDEFYFSEASGGVSNGRVAVTAWTGGGGDDMWSTGANWSQTPLTQDLLVFDGTTQTTNYNDLDTNYVPAQFDEEEPPNEIAPEDPASFLVGGIRFDEGADPFILQGNALDFTDKTITNNSPNTQTLEVDIQCDSTVGSGGFSVDAAVGDVVLNGLHLRNGYNDPINKSGPGTLTINGPLVGPDTWQPFITEGTLVANNPGGNLFFHTNISAGATLVLENNEIHNGGRVSNNGTLDLAGDSYVDVGALFGSGLVTNHGAGGTTATLGLRQGDDRTFSGTIEDGPSGGMTSLEIGLAGRTETGVLTLSGVNTYGGHTVFPHGNTSLVLAETGSLTFWAGANGENNQITALEDQNDGALPGTTTLDGTFRLDLGGAAVADGNSWQLVDLANLDVSFGETFQVRNANYVPMTSFQVNGGGGDYAPYENNGAYVSGGGNAGWPEDARDTDGVTDPAPVNVYDEYRYGSDFTYTFTGLGAGAGYDIRLHFLEGWHSSAGNRIFDVIVNGVTMIDDIDLITASGGKNIAFTQTINATADLSGTLTIRFLDSPAGSDSNAAVSAIEINPDGTGDSFDFSDPGATGEWTAVDGANTWTFSESTGALSLAVGAGGGTYAEWIAGYPGVGGLTGFDDDADGDGLTNGVESYLGTDPSVFNAGIANVSSSGGTFSFEHPMNATPPSDVTGAYIWSLALAGWNADGATEAGTTVDFAASPNTPSAGTTTVTATITGTVPPQIFTAIEVNQNP